MRSFNYRKAVYSTVIRYVCEQDNNLGNITTRLIKHYHIYIVVKFLNPFVFFTYIFDCLALKFII